MNQRRKGWYPTKQSRRMMICLSDVIWQVIDEWASKADWKRSTVVEAILDHGTLSKPPEAVRLAIEARQIRQGMERLPGVD